MARPKTSTKTKMGTQFSSLPLELREEIWSLTLPGPRVMRLNRSSITKSYLTDRASYGGNHPCALSVNRESRAVALRKLKLRFGAYWNMAIDFPYVELGYYAGNDVTLLGEMRKAGALNGFQRIAIDWKFWIWLIENDNSMEFRASCGQLIRGFEHPITTLNGLPSIKTCVFTLTEHTMQKDLINPGVPWILGPVDRATYLDDGWEAKEEGAWNRINEEKKQLKREDKIKFDVLGIHDRKRDPANAHKPPSAAWDYDWFG